MENLRNKVAIVTGASQGIGKAIATSLAMEGVQVALIASKLEALEKAAQEIRDKGGSAEPFACNLLDNELYFQTYDNIVKALGPIDILVNNVGAGTFKPMHIQTRKEASLPVQLPFGIAVAASHSVIPSMLARKSGHIVNLISPAGLFPLPYMAPYTASRYAMVGLSHSLYEELHHQGIGVTLVCPGQVNTGYFERNDADLAWYPKLSKVFPVLQPEQVGAAVVEGILKDKREVILPKMLEGMIRMYTPTPRLWVRLFKAFGWWGPSKEID